MSASSVRFANWTTLFTFDMSKNVELLLVTQHLQRRLAEDGEVQRRALGSRVREHELMGKCRLAAAWFADNQIERVLGPSAAEDVVELRHA